MKPSTELYQEVWSIRLVTVEPRGGRDLNCHSRSSKESWTQLDCPLEVSYAQAPIWSSLNFQRPCGTQTTLTNMTLFLNRFLLFRLTKNLLSSQSVLQLKFHIKLDLICYLLTIITHTHTHTHTQIAQKCFLFRETVPRRPELFFVPCLQSTDLYLLDLYLQEGWTGL